MRSRITLEINFYRKNEASVSMKSTASGGMYNYGKILLFSSYCLRQMHNLGRIKETSELASQLIQIGQNKAFLANEILFDHVTKIPYKGYDGKKRFIAELEFDSNRSKFLLHPKGFGLLGEGVNYYAPLSILLLLKHLSESLIDSTNYLDALALTSEKCAQAFIENRITHSAQLNLPIEITQVAIESTSAIGQYKEPENEERTNIPSITEPPIFPIDDLEPKSMCQACGQKTPTKFVNFNQQIGAIVMRFRSRVEGNLCAVCIEKYFWEFTVKTLLFGWWGFISFFVTPFVILGNFGNYVGTRGFRKHTNGVGTVATGYKTIFWGISGFLVIFLGWIFFPQSPSQATYSANPIPTKRSITLPSATPKVIPTKRSVQNLNISPTNTPKLCSMWYEIDAKDKGKFVCAKGTVVNTYSSSGENPIFYIRFSEKSTALRLVATSGYYYPEILGKCVMARGKVDVFENVPYINVTEELLKCP